MSSVVEESTLGLAVVFEGTHSKSQRESSSSSLSSLSVVHWLAPCPVQRRSSFKALSVCMYWGVKNERARGSQSLKDKVIQLVCVIEFKLSQPSKQWNLSWLSAYLPSPLQSRAYLIRQEGEWVAATRANKWRNKHLLALITRRWAGEREVIQCNLWNPL